MNEQLIFDIFTTIADEAIVRNCSLELRHENVQYDSKVLVAETHKDTYELTMIITPEGVDERSYEDGYDDGCMDLIDEDIETD